MVIELGYTFEELCSVLAARTGDDLLWVMQQIAMDDQLVEKFAPQVSITPDLWHQAYAKKYKCSPPTEKLDRLYFTYSSFLASIPNLTKPHPHPHPHPIPFPIKTKTIRTNK
jgi:hypothetical protein